MAQDIKKRTVLDLLFFPEAFLGFWLGAAVLLSTQFDSATIPLPQGMLQAALEMQKANEKRCDQWEDDLQKDKVSWEASGDPTS